MDYTSRVVLCMYEEYAGDGRSLALSVGLTDEKYSYEDVIFLCLKKVNDGIFVEFESDRFSFEFFKNFKTDENLKVRDFDNLLGLGEGVYEGLVKDIEEVVRFFGPRKLEYDTALSSLFVRTENLKFKICDRYYEDGVAEKTSGRILVDITEIYIEKERCVLEAFDNIGKILRIKVPERLYVESKEFEIKDIKFGVSFFKTNYTIVRQRYLGEISVPQDKIKECYMCKVNFELDRKPCEITITRLCDGKYLILDSVTNPYYVNRSITRENFKVYESFPYGNAGFIILDIKGKKECDSEMDEYFEVFVSDLLSLYSFGYVLDSSGGVVEFLTAEDEDDYSETFRMKAQVVGGTLCNFRKDREEPMHSKELYNKAIDVENYFKNVLNRGFEINFTHGIQSTGDEGSIVDQYRDDDGDDESRDGDWLNTY